MYTLTGAFEERKLVHRKMVCKTQKSCEALSLLERWEFSPHKHHKDEQHCRRADKNPSKQVHKRVSGRNTTKKEDGCCHKITGKHDVDCFYHKCFDDED
jgi:hypothetical protein